MIKQLKKKSIYLFSSIKDKIRKERLQRLSKLQQILPTKTNTHLEKIRNIAIIAHIDAGKTTTTERMLYYSGALNQPGEVDQGTTTMDYLPQQRARGITIRSAAISFNWNSHQINLIDTPGHVDFSGQVARSVRVLDGVVTIFDGVQGVQTQTQKVWVQANKKKLPKLCFINKMDRVGSSVQNTVKTIKQRMGADSLVLQYPIGQAQNFKGVVDLINMKTIIFEGSRGEDMLIEDVKKSDIRYQKYIKAREELIEKASQYNEEMADLYLKNAPINPLKLQNSIKSIVADPRYIQKVCPVFMGTAYKNKGIQTLLDGIINYLPSPTQRPSVVCYQNSKLQRKPLKTEKLCLYIFKIIYDKQKGPLAYARIYSGTLTRSMQLLNSTKNIIQKPQFLFRVRANQYVLVNQVCAGDIIAISGLKHTAAGDTMINMTDQRFVLQELVLPPPIFLAPFEVSSTKDQKSLEENLNKIILQDNSLQMKNDQQLGQLVVSGLGQLHLEIVRDRLIQQGIKVKMGQLRIGYKETILESCKKKFKMTKTINKLPFQIQLQIQIIPVKNDQTDGFIQKNEVVLSFKKSDKQFDKYWAEYQKRKTIQKKAKNNDQDEEKKVQVEAIDKSFGKYIKNPIKQVPINQEQQIQEYHISSLSFQNLDTICEAIKVSLMSGKFRYPLISLQVHITDGKYQTEKLSKTILNNCASKIINDLIQEKSVLVEPFVSVQLIGQQQMLQYATSDIIKKRGRIQNRQQRKIQSKIPAEGIRGWIKNLRAMGFDTDIKFCGYQLVQGIDPEKLLQIQNN